MKFLTQNISRNIPTKTTKLAKLAALSARKIFFFEIRIILDVDFYLNKVIDCTKIHPLDVIYLESFYLDNLEITIMDQC